MNFVGRLLSKLCRIRGSCYRPDKDKDNDDPANVLYETFEHGYRFPREEIGCGINLMKHRNEL